MHTMSSKSNIHDFQILESSEISVLQHWKKPNTKKEYI